MLTQERLVHVRLSLNLLLLVPKLFCQSLHTLLVLLMLSGHAFWFSLTYLNRRLWSQCLHLFFKHYAAEPFSCQSIQYLERQPGQARAWESSGHTKTSEVCSVWPYILQHKTRAETRQAGTAQQTHVSNVYNAVVYYSHMLMLHTKGPEAAVQDY